MFFPNDQGVLRRLRDNSRGQPEPLLSRPDLAARNNLIPVLLAILNNSHRTFVINAVRQRAKSNGLIVVDSEFLRLLDELFQEAVVQGLVDVDALRRDAHLAGVEQSAGSNLGHDLIEVDVVAHDAGVVARELEDQLLQGAGAVAQDALADGDGAREADVVDARVQRHLLAEVGAAVDGLEDAGG